jgi:hypothetical protein
MRGRKLLINFGIIFLIICTIIISIDIFKRINASFSFVKMQSTTRISSSSDEERIKYEPTNYVITNKDEILEKIKDATSLLKNNILDSKETSSLFEIGNIHKIENLFYEYKSYAIVKYKLLNIIEALPKLTEITLNYTDEQLESYFIQNASNIENVYGITKSNEFIGFVKSIRELDSIKSAIISASTISFNYNDDRLNFYIEFSDGRDSKFYFVDIFYYNSNTNQIRPYLTITYR